MNKILIELRDVAPHCHLQPILDTWDKNELRSIYCRDCGLRTKSYWSRQDAYDEWLHIHENANEDTPEIPGFEGTREALDKL